MKQWKISEADYKERMFWDDYMAAYEDAISRCRTEHAPWFIIPANHKWFRDLAVARIIVEHLEGLNMQYPKPRADLERIRRGRAPAAATLRRRLVKLKLAFRQENRQISNRVERSQTCDRGQAADRRAG